ncbi:acetyl-CoA carboxylase biotin carboxylase subunit [Lacticaseibacillus thailandensis]|uniref:biotin carboxylase n=1 Tax=Lacticaseibacillus thailandensis DSM 22698 = JCM 13996 TaxID=1423810 RepID=A0A0R2C946_9LACO|nr:acetyl-CoA carboxylase biotin carboxylase subunit [Lacticaseibacillus thailandensis]KRM87898.1 biotin carboxylase [Lacticaseibacillus thailandensis DSM 22698 = JCM 13996]
MFNKVLVANRGEVAVQIIRTLREVGIRSVAVHSTADREAYFTQLADEAVCIGGPLPGDSYLNMKEIISTACLTGCDAIHPGYGFLSENAQFAQMCAECDLTFIGPSSQVIAQMGDKARARAVMAAAGVPVIPGSTATIDDINGATRTANQLGYPVVLKATAGGGGKGMRLVANDVELRQCFSDVQREAHLSFGAGDVYMEKVITHAKHIEVQVFADDFDHVVYFPERDCSLQRHHQKLVEESPSQVVTPEQRAELGALVVKACRAIQYRNTGTFEFLMDANHHFYFMEMNTRLQVEHAVTEEVTGVNLIAAQILVAAGEPLPWGQSDIHIRQYAVECRINAEDPEAGFLPAAGRITGLVLPTGTLGVRIDSSMVGPTTIAPYYDSMISKVVVGATDRHHALRRMRRVLAELRVEGVATNRNFLRDLVAAPAFANDKGTINYVEQEFLPRWLQSHE